MIYLFGQKRFSDYIPLVARMMEFITSHHARARAQVHPAHPSKRVVHMHVPRMTRHSFVEVESNS